MGNKKSILEKFGLVEKIDPDLTEETESEIMNQEIRPQPKKESETTQVQQPAFDRLVDIEELYRLCPLNPNGWNTIFIIADFLKALPEYLPESVKSQSVKEIIASSGMSLDNLIKDGRDRITAMKDFLTQFMATTNGNITNHEKEIAELAKRIEQLRNVIEEIKKLQTTQKTTIQYEIQKVTNIIDFASQSK